MVNISDFVARIVPKTANYFCVCWPGDPKPDGKVFYTHRFFPLSEPDSFTQAEGLVHWAMRKGYNTYFALAGFTLATQETNQFGPFWKGSRKAENVQNMRVLVIDADVQRPGDGKGDKAFATRAECLQWVADFARNTGIHRPTAIVNSGYGFHFYWVLDTNLTVAQWKPVAEAFLRLMQAHGWVGDTQATIDSVRILRPPGTLNMKVKGAPAPVTLFGDINAKDTPLADVMTAVSPYIQAVTPVVTKRTGTGGSAGSAIPFPLGARPEGMPEDTSINQNAGAGFEGEGFPERVYKFSNIYPKCAQLKFSVDTHGEHDSRDIWRLDNMPVLAHCVDGEDWVHPISDGYPSYKQEETEEQFAQTRAMVANKNLGPTKCATFDRHRPDVCKDCVFQGRISTPLQLGEDDEALPRGWRIQDEQLQQFRIKNKEPVWETVALGTFSEPECRQLASRLHELTFTYQLGNTRERVAVTANEASTTQGLAMHLSLAGVDVAPEQASKVGVFIVAWINKLKAAGRVLHSNTPRPFGWNIVDGKCVGFAVAGTLYHVDGTEHQLMVPDGTLASAYTPTGDPGIWYQAAKYIEGGNRPDLQVGVAGSFGAPLMGLTSDVAGMTVNMWSPASSVGKTTVFRFAQAIWGDRANINSKSDTTNSFFNAMASTRALIRYWDEYQGDKDQLTTLVYDIPQGRERNRMTHNIKQRAGGQWESVLFLGSNRALCDTLMLDHTNTDAAVLRILDIPLPKQSMTADGTLSRLVNDLKDNYGHVGRIYARYLGSNHDGIKAMLVRVHDDLAKTINRSEERFYLAVCTALLVGAAIARQLKLFDFDIQGVKKVLIDAVLAQRATRAAGGGFIQADGSYDVASIVGNFTIENARRVLRTDTMAGIKSKSVNVEMPWPSDGVIVQIATSGTIRLHKSAFNRWLEEKHMPSGQILSQMRSAWQVKEHKVTLGGGTSYATAQILCLDIDKATAKDANLDAMFDTGREALV